MNRTGINIILSIILASLTIAASSGCGDEAESVETSLQEPVDTLVLAVTDTIGLEMGDSSYVFGMILQAA